MKRRTFMKALGSSALLGGAVQGFSRPRHRAGKGGTIKKLVVLFQRGGNDGLNTLVPVSNPQYGYYSGLRPTVALPQGNLINVTGTSGFFALHPSIQPLRGIIEAGDLTMVHAVGYPNPDGSHFESQAYLETGVPGVGLMDGWLNRFLQETTGPGLIRGISIGSNIPQSVTGSVPVPVSSNFGRAELEVDPDLGDTEADAYRQKLSEVLALPHPSSNDDVYNTGNRIFEMIDSFADRDRTNYVPDNGVTYPNSRLGDRVSHAAQMLKDDSSFLGVEVVTIDQGGYDNHSNQLNPAAPTQEASSIHARLLRDMADCMRAFYDDMGPVRMQDTMFLVVSEFGRRAYQNDSNGTDHGVGSLVLAMGGTTTGNMVNEGANWPGLHNNDLLYGNLDWVTDFRDIYWEVLSGHMGVNNTTLNTILPGHIYTPVGL
ncbi:MAG: DUF1501 domain-containing protein [Acidobacteriota bacterium]|nr:DUF1501 domain-containing protein [Acidobacteriota bacterium]